MRRIRKNIFQFMVAFGFAMIAIVNLKAQTVCENKTGTQGGFTYEYWKSAGEGCLTLGSAGAFSVTWDSVDNLLARKSTRPGSMRQIVKYAADYQPQGRTFLCVYGWTKNPLIEYYIVESYEGSAPGGSNLLGTVETDSATYNIYRTERVNKPSIEGTKTFYQYWSIRTSKRTQGTVTCANHFNAWAKLGLNMGTLWEVSFCLEALRNSSGTCNVKSLAMSVGAPTGLELPQTDDTNSKIIISCPRGSSVINIDSNMTFKKMDILGYDGRLVLSTTSNMRNINVSNFSAGIYLLKFTDSDNVSYLKKFIKHT